MESQRLQTGMVRFGTFSRNLLRPGWSLPLDLGQGATKNVRASSSLLQRVQRPDTPLVRPWLLRQYRYDQMVESIHGDTMAGFDSSFCISNDPWKRRTRKAHETNDREVTRIINNSSIHFLHYQGVKTYFHYKAIRSESQFDRFRYCTWSIFYRFVGL